MQDNLEVFIDAPSCRAVTTWTMPLTTLDSAEFRMVYGICRGKDELAPPPIIVTTPSVRVSSIENNAGQQWEGTVHGGAALVSTYSFANLDASNVVLSEEHAQPGDVDAETSKACLVDGNTDSGQWNSCPHYHHEGCDSANPPYVTIDLKAAVRIGTIRTTLYNIDARTYCSQTIELSLTGDFEGEQTFVLDDRHLGSGHAEANNAVEVDAHGAVARFVRHRSSRNTINEGVHFIEMAIETAPLSRPSALSFKSMKSAVEADGQYISIDGGTIVGGAAISICA